MAHNCTNILPIDLYNCTVMYINECTKVQNPRRHQVSIFMVLDNTHARFPQEKWPTIHMAFNGGSAGSLQRSCFRETPQIFRPPLPAEYVSVFRTNRHSRGEMWLNRHTDRQTKYCNPCCACAPRVNEYIVPCIYMYIHVYHFSLNFSSYSEETG